MKGEEQQVKQAVEQIGSQVGIEAVNQIRSILDNVMTHQMPVKEAMGVSDEKIENIYSHAYQLYNSGKYEEASHLFRLLMILEPMEVKHYIGLAATMHLMKEFENAVKIYLLAGTIDADNPVPYFHASDCYIQMKDKPSALIMLDMAIKKANKPEYQVLKDRALLTSASLKKELLKTTG